MIFDSDRGADEYASAAWPVACQRLGLSQSAWSDQRSCPAWTAVSENSFAMLQVELVNQTRFVTRPELVIKPWPS